MTAWPQTPVVPKTKHPFEWPEGERVFYVLGSNGLHLCRDHEFFRSCVPARGGPGELEAQEPFLTPRFPVVPRRLFERIVGFFGRVGELYCGEAAVLLFWDKGAEQVRVVVPPQRATISVWSDGYKSPIGLHYEKAVDVPADWVPFGDAHSHVQHAAYCSHTDQEDESHDAGLHIVVGRVHEEPPELHVEAVVDGQRFVLDVAEVVAGYDRRDAGFPQEWLAQVEIDESPTWWGGPVHGGHGAHAGDGSQGVSS